MASRSNSKAVNGIRSMIIEIMEDSEVYLVAEYKGVQIFVEKIATKPYDRIYTKFDKNKFRYFERRDR